MPLSWPESPKFPGLSKVSSCLQYFNWGERSGLLSVGCFLHAYWTTNLLVLAPVSDLPAFSQDHFLGSLSCFNVVGDTLFSHIQSALPNVSDATIVLFILRDCAYTTRGGCTSEFLALGWNIPQLPSVSLWGTTWACTNLPSSCPVLHRKELWLLQPKGN